MNILVIGSGGREHAICYALLKSSYVENIYCVPGNAGTALSPKCVNISLTHDSSISDVEYYVQLSLNNHIDLVIAGNEEPLAQGVADALAAFNIPCVGPKKRASMLEADKDFAKEFMTKYNIPCAKSKTFTSISEAEEYIKTHPYPLVIKAAGLAAGKGVVIVNNEEEARSTLNSYIVEDKLGEAGHKVVIEDYLEGKEISMLCAVSVSHKEQVILPFLPARDHKKAEDGAKGLNTGGMGAVCPAPDVTPEIMKEFQDKCLTPTLEGIKSEFGEYKGFLFFGLMLTKEGIKVLEFNVRLGDPETQAVLPLIRSDFYLLCKSIVDGTLSSYDLQWMPGFCVAPVAVSKGYPLTYKTGFLVEVDEDVLKDNFTMLFIAGAKLEKDNKIYTSGGRVLSCAAYGNSYDEAIERAYNALEAVNFQGIYYRHDIGREVKESK